MNLADALRRVQSDPAAAAALGTTAAQPQAAPQPAPQYVAPEPPATPQLTAQPSTSPAPEPASPYVAGGNVIRLELFLSAEQMSGLFKAIMAGQHTVMTAREAASYLRVSKETLMKYAEEGDIPGIVIDGRWRFPKANLDEWLSLQRYAQEEAEDAA